MLHFIRKLFGVYAGLPQKKSRVLDLQEVVAHTYYSRLGPLSLNCQAEVWFRLFRFVSDEVLLKCRFFYIGNAPDQLLRRSPTNVMMMSFLKLIDELIGLSSVSNLPFIYLLPTHVVRCSVEDDTLHIYARPHTWKLDFTNVSRETFVQSASDDSFPEDAGSIQTAE